MFDRLSQITLALAKKGGGGGGSTNYNDLDHKPKINNVELAGSLSLSDLDIQGELTAGTGINITGSTISVDADSAPTKNSQKPVTSGGTKSAIDASQNASLQMLKDTAGWTGKQLIPFPYRENSLTRAGVTFTVNSDGGVTLQTGSGGATANATLTLMYQTTLLNDKAVHCLLSTSKTEFIAETDVNLVYSVRNSDTSQKEYTRDNNFEITQANSPHSADGEMLNLSLWVKSGKVITTPITVYPLVCLPSVTDTSYEPYHEDVDTAKANNSALAPVENGTTASQAYAQGSHFMRNGDFCTAKTAIASGATLTENSNYTVGDVADMFKAETYDIAPSHANLDSTKHVSFTRMGNIGVWNGYFVINTDISSSNDILFALPNTLPNLSGINGLYRPFACLISETDITKKCSLKWNGRYLLTDGACDAGTYALNLSTILLY